MSDEPKSLAHPAWPYTGTPWEWRKAARTMTPAEIEAQRQSWVRGMTARCEHGAVDFEQCEQCRSPRK